jgi:hypothetical protein
MILLLSGCSLAAPDMTSPAEGETFSVGRPRVAWNPVRGTTGTEVEFYSESGGRIKKSVPAGEGSFVPADNLAEGDWQVRVRSRYPLWPGPWSRSVGIVIQSEKPELVTPGGSASFLFGEPVSCLWSRVSGSGMTYTLEWGRVDLAGVFQVEGHIGSLTEPEAVIENLPSGEWKLRVRGDTLWGASTEFGDTRTITVEKLLVWAYLPEYPSPDAPVLWFQTKRTDFPESIENFLVREGWFVPATGIWTGGYKWCEQAYSLHSERTGDYVPVYHHVGHDGPSRMLDPPVPFNGRLEAPGPVSGSMVVCSASDAEGRGVLSFSEFSGDQLVPRGEFYPGFNDYGSLGGLTLNAFSDKLKSGDIPWGGENAESAVWCTALLESSDGGNLYAAGVMTDGVPFDTLGRELPDDRLVSGSLIPWIAVFGRSYDDLTINQFYILNTGKGVKGLVPLAFQEGGGGEIRVVLRADNALLPGASVLRFERFDPLTGKLTVEGSLDWLAAWGEARVASAPGGEFLFWSESHLCPVVDWKAPPVYRMGLAALLPGESVDGYRFEQCQALSSGEYVLYGFCTLRTADGSESVPLAIRVSSTGKVRFAAGGPEKRLAITLEKP